MIIWKIIMVLVGVSILLADIYAFVLKKFTGLMEIGWGAFGLFVILLGAVPGLSDWSLLMNQKEYIAAFALFVVIVFDAFLVCMSISQLAKKNQELAMQVSLLNQENERILNELVKLTGKTKTRL